MSRPATRPRRLVERAGLGARLFAAMGLVVLAGATTLLAVALLVAPQVFHAHLRAAMGTIPSATAHHVNEAFAEAILLSLAMAVAVATVAALAVTWLVSRRIAVPVSDMAAAAGQLATGNYRTRVPEPGLGPEFTALASAFNTMAAQLAATEQVRQRLLADLAHELRTPLASIDAMVEALADEVLPADAGTWAALAEQAGRLRRLVEDIAAVSRAEERTLHPDLEPLALTDIVTTTADSAQARFTAKGVTLALRLDSGTPVVDGDRDRLAEALTNLLDNALRHTPTGGVVTVTTDAVREFGHTTARLRVTDTGEGFDPALAGRLFERFYRADAARTRDRAGSGIGLTITKAIVTAHHGTIHAESGGPGHGATFTVALPEYRRQT
jgi:two-component system sensor histidine kinase BaeS